MEFSRKTYRLADGIRVRHEEFGLLFYDPNGPRLTLVHSGQWLEKNFFFAGIALDQWLRDRFRSVSEWQIGLVQNRLTRALAELVERGLVVDGLADS